MKENRVEKLVDDLKQTVERLNRLTTLLNKNDTSYALRQTTRDGEWLLEDVEQRVKY